MTELAKRYGGSLYDLAAEEKLTEELLQELQTAVDSIEAEPQYKRLLATPGVPEKERCALLDKALRGGASVPCQLSRSFGRGKFDWGTARRVACLPGPLQ